MKVSFDMSEILIRGMEMPETGVYILSVDKTDADAAIFTVSEQTNSGKIIPKHVGEAVTIQPHGSLKDADAFEKHMSDTVMGDIRGYPYDGDTWDLAFSWLDHAKTIIPASK